MPSMMNDQNWPNLLLLLARKSQQNLGARKEIRPSQISPVIIAKDQAMENLTATPREVARKDKVHSNNTSPS